MPEMAARLSGADAANVRTVTCSACGRELAPTACSRTQLRKGRRCAESMAATGRLRAQAARGHPGASQGEGGAPLAPSSVEAGEASQATGR
eukprot:COSAG01_NODE_2484_length_7600_cov_2.596587_5_plen_91_part_00